MSNHQNGSLLSALNAVERNPESAHAHCNLGMIYYLMGRDKDAIAALERAIELNPNMTAAYNILGAVYFHRLETEAGIAAFKSAIELEPNDDIILSNLGNFYRHLGHIDEAILAFEDTLRLNSRNSSAYLGLAAIEVALGQYEQFENHLSQARECLRPDDDYNQAMLAALTSNNEDAIKYLSKLPYHQLRYVKTDPVFGALRKDPRVQKLLSSE